MKTYAQIERGIAAVAIGLILPAAALAQEPPPAGVPHVEVPFNAETMIRQDIIQTALGREPADLLIHGANVLNVFTLSWMPNSDIVVKGERIAWVGPAGEWKGTAASTFDASNLFAVPGFGESHKHIESTNLSPEWEAALIHPARKHLDRRGIPRDVERERRAQCGVLADGGQVRQPP